MRMMMRIGATLLLAVMVIFPLEQTATAYRLKPFIPPPRSLDDRQITSGETRATAASVKSETLSLGIAAANAEKKIAEHQDFVNYLTRRLFSSPDLTGTVIVVPTALQVAQLLIETKVDFFMDSAYPTHIIG